MAQQTTWRKSSHSGQSEDGECVEVAFSETSVGLRDSKNSTSGELTVTPLAWHAFLGLL